MIGADAKVLVTGVGLAVEASDRRGWSELLRDLQAAGHAQLAQAPRRAHTRHRDDKVLSPEDTLAVSAAERAIADAFAAAPPSDRVWGSISFTTSKLTIENERSLPFTAYRKPDDSADTLSFRRAIDTASISVDPLELLRRLDNNVSWWISKSYGFGGINLQIGQSHLPDASALIAAIDLVESGACDSVLVGGGETISQSAVDLSRFRASPCAESDPEVGGGAIYFVLERPGLRPPSDAYVSVSFDLAAVRHEPAQPCHYAIGTPGLAIALEVFRLALGLDGRRPSARPMKAGPICLWRPEHEQL